MCSSELMMRVGTSLGRLEVWAEEKEIARAIQSRNRFFMA
jgi:hypothetical protein